MPRAARGGRTTMNFWLPQKSRIRVTAAQQKSVCPPSPTIVYTTSPIWGGERGGRRGERNERQKRRALERRARDHGGWWLVVAGDENGGKGRGTAKRRARGERRLAANWISRKTWPPPGTPARLYGENHDTTAAHNTYYPRFVEVVALGNDVFLERRHRCRADDEIPDIKSPDYSWFSSSRTTRRARGTRASKAGLIPRYLMETIPVASFMRVFKRRRLP